MSRFDSFSSHDLELLVADLLRGSDEPPFEVFARGPDGGIDLRRRFDGALEVVQVKRYVASSFSELKRAAEKEKAKVEALDPGPDRYRFVTSKELTPGNKDDLVTVLKPHLDDPAEVIGGTELEQLIRNRPEVERRHPKLWLTSSTQLADMIQAGVRTRSAELLARIEEQLSMYVRVDGFDEAAERLHNGRVLIIAGDPGVGKTTLAHLLIADVIRFCGYDEPLQVTRNIEEAWGVFRANERQVIFYDDFLGRTALDRLDKNEDRSLVAFMRAVIRAPNTLFVLTTREYILRHAEVLHEELRDLGVEERRYLLHLKQYGLIDRAHIFVNHAVQGGGLSEEARAALLEGDNYRRIIEHKNYNPRTIAYVTGSAGRSVREEELANYVDFAVGVLDDPGRLWRTVFRDELDESQRALALSVTTVEREIELSDLKTLFESLAMRLGAPAGEEDFTEALRALDDSLLRVRHDQSRIFVTLRDASIQDYLTDHIASSAEHAQACLQGAVAFEQTQRLIQSAKVARRPERVRDLADAIQRTYRADSIAWREVFWDDEPEPRLTRQERDLPTRLLLIRNHMHGVTALKEALLAWWQERVRDLAADPDGGRTLDAQSVNRLVQAAKGELIIADPDLGERLVADMTRGLHHAEAWRRVADFHDLWPEAFGPQEWANLVTRCESWVYESLGSPEDLRYEEEIEDIQYAAARFDIEIDDEVLSHARSAVHEGNYRGDYTPPDDDGEPPAPTEADRKRVRALFEEFVTDS